jgi:hypothetical protein
MVIAFKAPAGSNTESLIAAELQKTQRAFPTNAELHAAKRAFLGVLPLGRHERHCLGDIVFA